jgi:hypothetical protein
LRQADQARTDFAALESDLQIVISQLARLPTRSDLTRTALGIIFATMMLTTLSLLAFLGRFSLVSGTWPTAGQLPSAPATTADTFDHSLFV